MFLEPFPIDIARNIPPANIQKPQPMEFEIRLIVWEVFNVVIPEGKKVVSIYASVALDSNANKDGIEIVK
jgi:hypothetical protein